MRVGLGFDVHPFDASRPLVLGGVHIEGVPGLAGHSDADVLCHAIADAVLGAAGLGDLGTHFPDTDAAWRGVASTDLLRRVVELARTEGHRVSSADATVLLETPKIGPHVPAMRALLSDCLGAPVAAVSVKATTHEGLGFVGRREGAACLAVVLLESA